MTNLSLLEMGKIKKRSVRETIISILSKEFPLNIKKIYNKIKKEYNLGVTYQAVFKLIKEMLEDGILKKNDKEYQLNLEWIKELENELNIIKKNYLKESEATEPFQDRINKFISELGPKIKEYIGKDEACVVTLSGTGYYYALNLWKYLQREGKNVNFIEIKKIDLTSGKKINFNRKDLENKKILIVDYGIFSGSFYKLLIDTIKPLRNRYKIKDIKFIVDIDLVGLSDFAVTKTSMFESKRII